MYHGSGSYGAARAILLALAMLGCIASTARPGDARELNPQSSADQGGAPTAAELVNRFRRAHDARSLDDLRRLVYWGHATEELRRSFERAASADFGKTIASAAIESIASGEVFQYSQGGTTFRPTLPPTGRLKIAFASSGPVRNETTEYLVGRSNGAYYLVVAEPAR